MRFSAWYEADEIERRAPAGSGVFQVRAPTLLDYPAGRSAMVHYGRGDELRSVMLAWAARHGRPGWRYRHAQELGSKTPEQVLTQLERRFLARFGAPPTRPGGPAPG